MHLKSLSLYGYKSFASRCTFEFADGITAIVGPNGSGKSNVADAVRWVLGEQSFRSLRARTTEDMIFAGSRHRSRLGMAEAILTLDNSEHWLPVDYGEVTIGRRAFRSGENEYLLNDSRVRYRDILDLLGAAGLSRTTYTVIGQGMVDAALALRPEARRVLFEEAAGISPQLRKRADALERIDETERNLERVVDILNELSPRVSELRRQAERTEEYRLLDQDLAELLRIWYGHRWHQLIEAEAAIERMLAEAQTALSTARQRSENASAEQQRAAQALTEVNERLRVLQAEVAAHRANADQVRQQLALSAERQRLYERQLADITSEQHTLASRQSVLAQEMARAEQELAALVAQHEAVAQELAALGERRAEVDRAVGLLQAAIQAREAQWRATQAQAAQQQARQQELQARLDRLTADAAQAQREAEAQQKHLQTIARQIAPLAEQRRQVEAAIAQGDERLATLGSELDAAQQDVRAAQAAVEEIAAQRTQIVARRNALARQREESAEYAPGVRHILALSQSLGGILGTAASLMEVPQAYEQAIEAALGSRLQNIITQRWADAERAIERLKQDRAGWATFLPLDTLQTRSPLHQRQGNGVIGVASQLVRFPENLRAVYELLLGRVLVVDNLPAARRLLAERTGASLIVTLSGETVQPTGAVSGGARRNNSQLLAQERIWRELPGRIAQVEERLREAEATLAAHRARVTQVHNELDQLGRERQRQSREREQLAQALAELEANRRVADKDRKWQADKNAQALAELQRAHEDLAACTAALEILAADEQAQTTALADLRERLTAANDEPLRRRLAELETQAAVAQRAIASQEQLLASHRDAARLNQEQLDAKATQYSTLTAALTAERKQTEALQEQLAGLEQEATTMDAQLGPAQQLQAAAVLRQRQAEEALAAHLARAREAETELHRIQLDLDRAHERQRDLITEIESALGPVELPDAVSRQLRLGLNGEAIELPAVSVVPEGLEQEVRALRARIRRLGGVNPDAPQEYQALLERQAFLQSQMTDLQEAIAALRQVIQELDEIIEKDFAATVQVVDRAFREYFRRLFDGGSAHLELTNPQDLSTSGVEIVAHPPGKRSQALSLLSGGERALTAVALVFALLQASPVPFCFLDEVDAALDEANVGRFRDLLLEHARASQFVVITHNRRTIEIANTIYGISMGEQGVSESVSLKLEEDTMARLESGGAIS